MCVLLVIEFETKIGDGDEVCMLDSMVQLEATAIAERIVIQLRRAKGHRHVVD